MSFNTEPPNADADDIFLLSDEQRQLSDKIQLVIRYAIVMFAIPLTVCNVVVFLQKSMRCSTSVYVIFLSIAQLIFIVVNLVVDAMKGLVEQPFTKVWFCVYYLYIAIIIGLIAKRGSYLVNCLLSIERLYAIIRPMHVRECFLSKFPVLCICLAYLVSALFHVYLPTRTIVVPVTHPITGHTVCSFRRTNLYLKTKAVNDFFSMTTKIVLSYGSLFGQVVLNALTIWALRRHNIRCKAMMPSTDSEDSRKQRERQLTVTILSASIMYVTLSAPYVLNNVLSTLIPAYFEAGKYGNMYNVSRDLTFNLTILSMAIDFVCFFTMSANYRKALYKLLPWKRNNSPAGKVTETRTSTTSQHSSQDCSQTPSE